MSIEALGYRLRIQQLPETHLAKQMCNCQLQLHHIWHDTWLGGMHKRVIASFSYIIYDTIHDLVACINSYINRVVVTPGYSCKPSYSICIKKHSQLVHRSRWLRKLDDSRTNPSWDCISTSSRTSVESYKYIDISKYHIALSKLRFSFRCLAIEKSRCACLIARAYQRFYTACSMYKYETLTLKFRLFRTPITKIPNFD